MSTEAKRFKSQQEAHNFLRTLPKPARSIHPRAIIYRKYVKLGENIHVGPYAVIGKEGFGFDPATKFSQRWPHIGNVVIGSNVEIGANTCIDRGTLGSTILENNVKLDNLVHVGHNVHIKKGTLVVAGSVLGGSSVIGEGVFIGMGALIRDHVTIGARAFICMGAVVTKDIAEGEKVRPS